MLQVRNLNFEYHDRYLLRAINFIVKPGGLLFLRGKNGAGKTTLLRLIAGLFQPDSGDITYKQQSIYQQLPEYQRELCFIGHKLGINPLLTVKENILYDLKFPANELSIEPFLEKKGMKQIADKLCGQLSAGQKRKISLLRLFYSQAKIWLLDEPLVALDKEGVAVLMDCINTHLQQDGMVIMTSHQLLPLSSQQYTEYQL